MTTNEIKAELRRSALHDADPLLGIDGAVFLAARKFAVLGERLCNMNSTNVRTFFLLVAEAL